jgi:hypothetical protein
MMEAEGTSEMLVSFYQTTLHNIPEAKLSSFNLWFQLLARYFSCHLNFTSLSLCLRYDRHSPMCPLVHNHVLSLHCHSHNPVVLVTYI